MPHPLRGLPPIKPLERRRALPVRVLQPGPQPTTSPWAWPFLPSPARPGTVTAQKAGGLRDMALEVDPDKVGVKAALQHLAKAVNIAFQTDYGENYLESVYQAAIVRNGEVDHRPQGVFRVRRHLVRPVRQAPPLAATDARRPRPRLARGAEADRREGPGVDPGPPQPARPQARPRRRVRGPRPRLRRADVRPARSLGDHRRLGPRRLGHLDHPHRPRHPDRPKAEEEAESQAPFAEATLSAATEALSQTNRA